MYFTPTKFNINIHAEIITVLFLKNMSYHFPGYIFIYRLFSFNYIYKILNFMLCFGALHFHAWDNFVIVICSEWCTESYVIY